MLYKSPVFPIFEFPYILRKRNITLKQTPRKEMLIEKGMALFNPGMIFFNRMPTTERPRTASPVKSAFIPIQSGMAVFAKAKMPKVIMNQARLGNMTRSPILSAGLSDSSVVKDV